MSNNFKPSETMMKSQENKDGHAPRFSHCHRNSQRSVHPHFWWWFWRVLRHHPTLYKDTQPKKQTWNPKLADLQMFLQRWGEFSGPFSGSIYVCFFKGGVFQHNVNHRSPGRHTDIISLIMEVFVESMVCLRLQEEKIIKMLQEAPKKRLHITESSKTKDWMVFGLNCLRDLLINHHLSLYLGLLLGQLFRGKKKWRLVQSWPHGLMPAQLWPVFLPLKKSDEAVGSKWHLFKGVQPLW